MKLLLIDGNNIYRRIHGANKELGDDDSLERAQDAANKTVGAVIKDVRKLQPTHVLVVFDGSGPCWRSKLYPAYKQDESTGERKQMAPVMCSAIAQCVQMLKERGLFCLQREGVEADDTIGIIAHKLTGREGIEVIIDSTDKDFGQFFEGNVSGYNRFEDKLRDSQWVKDKFDIDPEQVADFLALSGDSSDNIPGAYNIGEKRAAKLLQEYGNLENLLLCAEDVGGKTGERLVEDVDQIRLYRKLTDLKIEDKLDFNLSDLRLTNLRQRERNRRQAEYTP